MARVFVWVCLAAVLGIWLVLAGNVFPDEGWYLYAGRLVADGCVPYRDFAHFQAPLGPYLFACADGDLFAGRLICLTFGLGAIALALDIARVRGADVLVATALVLVPATYTLRWFAVARNIAPAAFFLTLGVWLVERRGARALAACAIAVAAGFRLSAAGGLAALVLHDAVSGRRRCAVVTVLSGAGALVAIFGPFALISPSGFLFGTLTYHTGLHADGSQLWLKAQGLWRLAEHHHLLAVMLVLACWRGRSGCLEMSLAAKVALGVTALHLIPGRLHPEYHELVMPLLALVVGGACTSELAPRRWTGSVLTRCVIVLLMIAQLGGARGQLWARGGWSPAMIEDVGQVLAAVAPVGEPVITFVPDFALAADRPLMHGLEMASVSVARPDEMRAAELGVVTLYMMRDALRSRVAGAVVWRELDDADERRVGLYGEIERGEVGAALREGYEMVGSCHGWTVWRRRSA